MVELLISSGADISVKDTTGRTALMHALEQDYDDIASLLEKA